MVRAEMMLTDVKVHCSTILHCFPLFHMNMRICVSEHLRKNLIHHRIINFEYINLIKIDPVQSFLIQLEVHSCADNGSSGNHLLV